MFQKKSLGQNFLKSEKALQQIVDAGDIQSGIDTIIEIGPGEGVLTDRVIEKRPRNLVIIEKDDRLIPILCEKLALREETVGSNTYAGCVQDVNILLMHKDVTEIGSFADLAGAKSSENADKPKNTARNNDGAGKSYKIIANIPYYITGLIIRQLFSQEILPEKIVLMMQKEVIDRIVSNGAANEGKESLLSASIKFYGTPKRVAVVPRGAFVPAPTVDSAILLISDIRKPAPELEKAYFEIIKLGFAHKRKRLAKNLDGLFSYNSKKWESVLAKMKLGVNIRAEEIPAETYAQMAEGILNDSF